MLDTVAAKAFAINAEILLAYIRSWPACFPQFFASSTLADRWKEFRENRKQLRCCNWIQLPTSQSPDVPAVKAGRRMEGARACLQMPNAAGSQKPEYFPDLLSFAPP